MKKRFPKLQYDAEECMIYASKDDQPIEAITDLIPYSKHGRIPKYKLTRADKYGPEIVRRWNLIAEQEAKC
jgi:hypothetical protein